MLRSGDGHGDQKSADSTSVCFAPSRDPDGEPIMTTAAKDTDFVSDDNMNGSLFCFSSI